MNVTGRIIKKSEELASFAPEHTLEDNIDIGYPIYCSENFFGLKKDILKNLICSKRAFCVIDKNVYEIYGEAMLAYFEFHKIDSSIYILETSEKNKTVSTLEDFAHFCLSNGISRRDIVVAIGGGVAMDIAALAANLIKRNTACIKIPTTLIGVVDAAIGVKTGVNFANIKNSLGTYCPPLAVIIDYSLLYSLNRREVSNGLSEIIKIIAIKSKHVWSDLKECLDDFYLKPYSNNVKNIIHHSIRFMLEELQGNLFEHNLRRIVDYGHEFGHEIETLSDHALTHGEAVLIGMLLANFIAYRQGLLSDTDLHDFIQTAVKIDPPRLHDAITANRLYSSVARIKKHKNGRLDLVSISAIGEPIFVNEVGPKDIEYALDRLRHLYENQRSIVVEGMV